MVDQSVLSHLAVPLVADQLGLADKLPSHLSHSFSTGQVQGRGEGTCWDDDAATLAVI